MAQSIPRKSVQETTTRAGPVTVEQYMAVKHRFVEVVNGKLVKMSPPRVRHVRIGKDLFRMWDAFVEKQQLGTVWPDGMPYVLDTEKRTGWVKGARMPDVSFVSRQGMEAHSAEHGEDGPLFLAPDLAVEIVSPGDSYTDVNEKVRDYLRYGTRMVIVIDPKARTIRVHSQDQPDGRTLEDTDVLVGDPVLPGWSAPVALILDGPPAPSEE